MPNRDAGDESAERKGGVDLMVVVPKQGGSGSGSSDRVESKILVREITDRLESSGFTHMALTHVIFGRPRPKEDRLSNAIPNCPSCPVILARGPWPVA